MSTHPNVILMAVLTPDGLSRKTMKLIWDKHGIDSDIEYANTDIKIENKGYHNIIMEDIYHEGYQISAKEGDLVFFDYVTYGYGDTIEWDRLQKQKEELEFWAKETSDEFDCSYKIIITANYW